MQTLIVYGSFIDIDVVYAVCTQDALIKYENWFNFANNYFGKRLIIIKAAIMRYVVVGQGR